MLEFLVTPKADAFIGDVATSIGTSVETEVASILAWPIGAIVIFILGLAVISFVVGIIMFWLSRRKG